MDIRPSSFARAGWPRGSGLLREDASAFDDPHVADQLGVGRNMAKSIEHWLLATGLAEKTRAPGPCPYGATATEGYRARRDDRAARSVVS